MIDLFSHIYNLILYQPIYNLVIGLYNLSPGPNLGWAIVMLSIIVRLAFLPLTLKGYKTDNLLEEIAHTIHGIENDPNLDSKEKRSRITEVMRSKGINPISEVLSVVGQLLFLLVLYQIVQKGLHPPFHNLYSFITTPTNVNTIFFFGTDVSKPFNLLYCSATAVLLFIEQVWEYESKKNIPEATFSGRWYPLLLPISTFILLMILPATKAVFLFVSILFSLGIRLMFTIGRMGRPKEANV